MRFAYRQIHELQGALQRQRARPRESTRTPRRGTMAVAQQTPHTIRALRQQQRQVGRSPFPRAVPPNEANRRESDRDILRALSRTLVRDRMAAQTAEEEERTTPDEPVRETEMHEGELLNEEGTETVDAMEERAALQVAVEASELESRISDQLRSPPPALGLLMEQLTGSDSVEDDIPETPTMQSIEQAIRARASDRFSLGRRSSLASEIDELDLPTGLPEPDMQWAAGEFEGEEEFQEEDEGGERDGEEEDGEDEQDGEENSLHISFVNSDLTGNLDDSIYGIPMTATRKRGRKAGKVLQRRQRGTM